MHCERIDLKHVLFIRKLGPEYMRATVSVVMPNYNHARYVEKALISVIPQLCDGDELIVIDDASSDESISVITQLIRDVPNARLIRHGQNRGVLETLNEGLSVATREYVCFPGSDDRVGTGVFDMALGLLSKHPAAGVCSGMVKIIDHAGKTVGSLPTRPLLPHPGYLEPKQVGRELVKDDSWVGGLAFYRTEWLRAVGGFRPELSNFADGFACRVLAARHGCCFVPVTFQYWRRVSEGLSWRETSDAGYVEEIGSRAVKLMHEVFYADFPENYPSRWLGRWRFGASYFAIQNRQQLRWQPALAWSERKSGLLKTVLSAAMVLTRLPMALALFAKHRPWDFPALIRRRLAYLLRS